MTSSLQTCADKYFTQHFELTLETLLTPVNEQQAAGPSLRGSTIYSTIEKARRQDDASVPMGAWEHELKRADWDKVSTLTLHGLQKSKDMQLVAWLLEAQINQHGLSGIAPCLILMQQLCMKFWEPLYPPAEDGDLEYRANIIRWIAEKLLPALYLIPLIDDGNNGSYSWSHWEQAQRNQQLKTNTKNNNAVPVEGLSQAELNFRINATPLDHFLLLQKDLQQALQAISELSQTLDELLADDSPSMSSMATLLQQIQSFIEAELHKRGVRPSPNTVARETDDKTDDTSSSRHTDTKICDAATDNHKTGRTRAEAYATLAETAEFLMSLEPHSPVPYLVRRATEWGSLNTVELYQELFLRLNGQLNIFEMLGLEAGAPSNQ